MPHMQITLYAHTGEIYQYKCHIWGHLRPQSPYMVEITVNCTYTVQQKMAVKHSWPFKAKLIFGCKIDSMWNFKQSIMATISLAALN